jgi:hypothetical protein
VDGDGAVHFAAFAHQAAERELDLGLVGLGGEAREHLGGAVITIVDQVIEAGEILRVAAHAPGARGTPSEDEGRHPDHQETQQQDFGADTAQTHGADVIRNGDIPDLLAKGTGLGCACPGARPMGMQ